MGSSSAPSQEDPRGDGSTSRADGAKGAVSAASTRVRDTRAHRFDVFLSHNSLDKPMVQRLAEKLREASLEPWLDRWYLTGGARLARGTARGLACLSAPAPIFVELHMGSGIGLAKS